MRMNSEKDILVLENERLQRLLTINLLTPDNAFFSLTEGGFISLKTKDSEYKRVNVIRTFPFTAANEYLSVREVDGKQDEIGIIENLDIFDEDTKNIINKQLEIRYFMPKILRIYSIKEQYGHTHWHVLTDKGKCRFSSASGSGESVIQLGNRVIIKDSVENRYEIEDIEKLNPKELKKLDLYL